MDEIGCVKLGAMGYDVRGGNWFQRSTNVVPT